LNPQLPGGDYYASFVAPGYVQHNQDAFPGKLPDMHDLDVLYNTPSGSQDASHGGIYWRDTPLCPRHFFVLVDKESRNNIFVLSLSGDYVVWLFHNDGR
jgi:hypothetical protein